MDRMTASEIEHAIKNFGVMREMMLREKPEAKPVVELPSSWSSESHVPPILNQGTVGSCVGHGISNAECTIRRVAGQGVERGNPGWPYTLAKVIDNELPYGGIADPRYEEQRGTTIKAGAEGLKRHGMVPLHSFPPMESEDPKLSAEDVVKGLNLAWKRRITSYQSLLWEGQTEEELLYEIKKAIYLTGGALLGLAVTTAWLTYKGGILIESPYVIGGHCVMGCAYNDAKSEFLIPNSWGVGWGINGFLRYPYKQVKKHLIAGYSIGV